MYTMSTRPILALKASIPPLVFPPGPVEPLQCFEALKKENNPLH